MVQWILAVVIVSLAMAGLAIGSLLGRRCLKGGGCTGQGMIGPDGSVRSCPSCGRSERG